MNDRLMKDGYDVFTKDDGAHVRVWGSTERELFSRALLGLAAVLRPDIAPQGGKTVRIRTHIHGKDLPDTLERFLAHVIFESDMHDAVFSAADFIVVSEKEVECELIGKEVEHKEEEVMHVFIARPGIRNASGQVEVEFICEVL